jgi:hypothetical protein
MTLIFCATVLFSVWYYVENTRYEIVSAEGRAYKMDKKTGELWIVFPTGSRKLENFSKDS